MVHKALNNSALAFFTNLIFIFLLLSTNPPRLLFVFVALYHLRAFSCIVCLFLSFLIEIDFTGIQKASLFPVFTFQFKRQFFKQISIHKNTPLKLPLSHSISLSCFIFFIEFSTVCNNLQVFVTSVFLMLQNVSLVRHRDYVCHSMALFPVSKAGFGSREGTQKFLLKKTNSHNPFLVNTFLEEKKQKESI